ncbi:hypothetical protein BJF78_24680 [Pseudonocardia sp. CNS-139]|nr:hypothetical protein BJF78_24680 [Pseudonocardia sp. CNS-139]
MTEPFTRYRAEETAAIREIWDAVTDAAEVAAISSGRTMQAMHRGDPNVAVLVDASVDDSKALVELLRRGLAMIDLVYANCPPPNTVTAETAEQLEDLRQVFGSRLGNLTDHLAALEALVAENR